MDILVPTMSILKPGQAKGGSVRLLLTCKNYGQRVQLSVFECRVTQAQYEALRSQLLNILIPGQIT